MSESGQVGAIVLLRPASGATDVPITVKTLTEHAPDRDAAEHARRWFEGAGFNVGPLVGTSFSIVAPAAHMSSLFPDFSPGKERELRLDRLPRAVAENLQAVATESPPEFGPNNP